MDAMQCNGFSAMRLINDFSLLYPVHNNSQESLHGFTVLGVYVYKKIAVTRELGTTFV